VPSASPDDIVSMVFFARVVELRSFTAAAALLGVSKSVVSGRVARLEDRLGLRLLHRTTRKLSLTPDGLAFYERCAPVLAAADDAAAAASGAGGEPRGLLRVNAPVMLAQLHLAEPIAAYLDRYPEVRVDLVMEDRLVDLVGEGIDVALRVSAGLSPSSLLARKLADDRVVVTASPEYLARRGVPQSPADLVHHDCLRYSLLRAGDEWRFRDPGGKRSYSVPVEARFSAASGAVLRAAALGGMGLAVTPSFMVAADLHAGRLVSVLERFVFAHLGVHALHPPARPVPSKTRTFVDHLAAHFRKPPWLARG
jgi:DNA-binding transcriptional LysR family regulator